MNRYQKVVAIVAAVNVLLMLLFPPFLDNPMERWTARSFEGFYFLFMAPPGRSVYKDLLTIEVVFVLANALTAWLALNSKPGSRYRLATADIAGGLILFGTANLAIIGLFPPFEPYSSLVRTVQSGFDGFYFLFGDKKQRNIFMPMIYLECIVVAVNLLVAWLMLNIVSRGMTTVDEELVELAHRLQPAQEQELVEALRHEIEAASHRDPGR